MGYGMSDYIETNGTFTFGGIKSSDYDIWINGGGTYSAAARRHRDIVVPGRNGTLTIDEGSFEDVEVTYPAFIAKALGTNIEDFRNEIMALQGYQRLEDTYHPDEFYRAKYMRGLEPAVAPAARGASFDLTFQRDPRRFLTSGETTTEITASTGTISNPTLYDAKPLIVVTGYGQLTINSDVITIANTFAYVTIDCEIMDCYHGTDNANEQVTFQSNDFPVLRPGTNNIAKSNTITKVAITPRWWIV